MTTRVPVEEIEVSTGEKLLAVMLAIFISVGAIWAYVRIDDIGAVAVQPTPAEQTAIEANETANRAHFGAQRDVRAERNEVARTREAYRTALDADHPAAALEKDYVAAQAALDDVEGRLKAARAEVSETAPASRTASRTSIGREAALAAPGAGSRLWIGSVRSTDRRGSVRQLVKLETSNHVMQRHCLLTAGDGSG